jgi:uncharacterized protein YcnI
MRRGVLAPILGAGLLSIGASAAIARPQIEETQVDAGGGRTSVTLRVLGGCEGLDIDRVEMTVPEGVLGVAPEAIPGWTIEIDEVEVEPYELFGEELTTRVETVRWLGTLPDGQYADLGFAARFEEPGEVLFPVTQGCGTTEMVFDQPIPEGTDPAEVNLRAPVLTVVEPAEPVDLVALEAAVDQLRQDLEDVRTDDGGLRLPALRERVGELEQTIDRLRQRINQLEDGEEQPAESPAP